jgi:hypothetical protein
VEKVPKHTGVQHLGLTDEEPDAQIYP